MNFGRAGWFFLFCSSISGVPPLDRPQVAAPLRTGRPCAVLLDESIGRSGRSFVDLGRADALSIAAICDHKIHFYNFGSVKRGRLLAPTKDSVYEIGSITKLFTSLLLAQAVTEGRVGLRDDIRRYLPGSYPNLSVAGRPVQLVDLADTTSALPDNLPEFARIVSKTPKGSAPFVLAKILERYSEEDLLRDLRSVVLAGRPGEVSRHSNVAAELLAIILQRVYHASYAQLLDRAIQTPFGMQDGVSGGRDGLLVHGFTAGREPMPVTNQRSIMAAGGLRYSTTDMAKFLNAELTSSSASLRLSQTPAWGNPDRAVGMGWNISRNVESDLRLHASGGTFGSASYIEMYPDLGYGIVLLANRPGETESLLQDLAGRIFEATHGLPALDTLKEALQTYGYGDVGSVVRRVRVQHPELFLSELYVNNWAGGLLSSSPEAALGLFLYNVQQWPGSSDAYDSLGDGYVQVGDKSHAVAAYRRSLELNPSNQEASKSLKSLLSTPDVPAK